MSGRGLVTTSQAALAIGRTPQVIRQWATRGKIIPVGHEDGRPLYRLTDIEAVARQQRLNTPAGGHLTALSQPCHTRQEATPCPETGAESGGVLTSGGFVRDPGHRFEYVGGHWCLDGHPVFPTDIRIDPATAVLTLLLPLHEVDGRLPTQFRGQVETPTAEESSEPAA